MPYKVADLDSEDLTKNFDIKSQLLIALGIKSVEDPALNKVGVHVPRASPPRKI